jgi:hypothetical protein
MNKKAKVFLTFVFCSVLAYLLTTYIIQRKVENTIPTGGGMVNDTLLAIYYGFIGITTYFVALNMYSIIGLTISWRRKDMVATSAFKILTLSTAGLTIAYYLIYN